MFKLIIVDDEKIEREGIKFLINMHKLPFDVVEAKNGIEALDYLKENPVDIIFTDIKMPFMSGLELSDKAKAINPSVKIVIFSAYSDFDYAKKAISIKVFDYVLKPVDENEFINTALKIIELCKQEKMEKENTDKILHGYKKSLLYEKEESHILNDIENEKGDNSNEVSRKVIEDVIKIINEEYASDIGLEYIAEKVFLSPGYLSFLFKKELGNNLTKYITKYRLERSRDLLNDTNMKIVDISKKVGYSKQAYFCSIFKTYYGITPLSYRERMK
ncbi:response regulator [bacterium AH-315-N14]|nr:response regulator [bacterium AH-315-N14]